MDFSQNSGGISSSPREVKNSSETRNMWVAFQPWWAAGSRLWLKKGLPMPWTSPLMLSQHCGDEVGPSKGLGSFPSHPDGEPWPQKWGEHS